MRWREEMLSSIVMIKFMGMIALFGVAQAIFKALKRSLSKHKKICLAFKCCFYATLSTIALMVLAGMIGNSAFSTFTALMLMKAIEAMTLLTATSALYMLFLKVRAVIIKKSLKGRGNGRHLI
jgi:hypothetical protein